MTVFYPWCNEYQPDISSLPTPHQQVIEGHYFDRYAATPTRCRFVLQPDDPPLFDPNYLGDIQSFPAEFPFRGLSAPARNPADMQRRLRGAYRCTAHPNRAPQFYIRETARMNRINSIITGLFEHAYISANRPLSSYPPTVLRHITPAMNEARATGRSFIIWYPIRTEPTTHTIWAETLQ